MVFTRLFEPKDPSKAKAMILHSAGFGANVNWASHDLGVQYAQLGYVVFMFDHKGHGNSDGMHCQIDDFDKDIVDPAIWIFNYAINEYIKTNVIYQKSIDKPKNYFLSGASMGGANSIYIALREQQENTLNIKGMILLAPMCEISPEKIPSALTIYILKNVLLHLIPSARLISTGLDKMSLNEEVQKVLDQDPILCSNIALVTGLTLFVVTQFVEANAAKLKIPMLICQGCKDVVTNCDGCIQFFDKCDNIKAEDKEMKIYKDSGHMLWMEEPEMINDINQWISKYL